MSDTNTLFIATSAGVALVTAIATFSVIRRLRRSLKAEQAWIEAVSRSDADVHRLVEDLRREQELIARVRNTDFSATYLERTITELVNDLVTRGAMSAKDRRSLLAGLRQPSEEGRRLFARKLAEEALTERLAHMPLPPPPTPPRVAAMR